MTEPEISTFALSPVLVASVIMAHSLFHWHTLTYSMRYASNYVDPTALPCLTIFLKHSSQFPIITCICQCASPHDKTEGDQTDRNKAKDSKSCWYKQKQSQTISTFLSTSLLLFLSLQVQSIKWWRFSEPPSKPSPPLWLPRW